MTTRYAPWFVTEKRIPDPVARLFCFPYAGGSSQAFAGWQAGLAADVEVLALELPGRGRRFAEPLVDDLDQLARALARAIRPFLDRPFVFLGYSNGALVAYQLAVMLASAGLPGPDAVIVAAKRAPQLPPREAPLHTLPDHRFTEAIRRYNGTPENVLANRELMQLFLPVLRADFRLGETYQPRFGRALETDLMLMGGDADSLVPKADLLAWAELFQGPPRYQEFNGGHFFLHQRPEEMLRVVSDYLSALYYGSTPGAGFAKGSGYD